MILVVSKDKVNGALAAGNMALMAEAQGLGVLVQRFLFLALRLIPGRCAERWA